MARLLPVLLMILGAAAGLGAGLALRPAPEPAPVADDAPDPPSVDVATEIFEFPSQFMVPVITEGRIGAVMVLTLAMEVAATERPQIAARAPRLRDSFLQVMFDHANSGGFDGAFTGQGSMTRLRRALLEAAQSRMGPDAVFEVLITDLIRTSS